MGDWENVCNNWYNVVKGTKLTDPSVALVYSLASTRIDTSLFLSLFHIKI